ncbi:unnamed protein product [Amoebophrya sp. A25]|nr:unnamed protein product [Amoebophrya sp. A25]|eukprot:GSA25T00024333001.1
MAAATTTEDGITQEARGRLISEGLQCSICLDFYCEPLTLPACGHSFCRLCLLQSTVLAPDGRSCPQCRRPINEIANPATHKVDVGLKKRVLQEVGASAYARREGEDAAKLLTLLEREKQRLPVFYSANYDVGESLRLHFFEPRYKILIRRAWEGNKRFVCSRTAPLAAGGGEHVLAGGGVVVEVDTASFLADGRANIVGRAVAEIPPSTRCWIDDEAIRLWYAEIDPQASQPSSGALARRSSETRSRSSSRGRTSPTSISPVSPLPGAGARVGSLDVRDTQNAIRLAIQQGAPVYNSGDVKGCYFLYRNVAEQILLGLDGGPTRQSLGVEDEDVRAISPVRLCLDAAVQKATRSAEGERRSDFDRAAWDMRRGFDRVLQMQDDNVLNNVGASTSSSILDGLQARTVQVFGRGSLFGGGGPGGGGPPSSSTGAYDVVNRNRGSREAPPTPVLCFAGGQFDPGALKVGGRGKSLRLFEPRFRIDFLCAVAQNSRAGNVVGQRFLYSRGIPAPGSAAVLAQIQDCVFDGTNPFLPFQVRFEEGGAARLAFVGVAEVRLVNVLSQVDNAAGGLVFASYRVVAGIPTESKITNCLLRVCCPCCIRTKRTLPTYDNS